MLVGVRAKEAAGVRRRVESDLLKVGVTCELLLRLRCWMPMREAVRVLDRACVLSLFTVSKPERERKGGRYLKLLEAAMMRGAVTTKPRWSVLKLLKAC